MKFIADLPHVREVSLLGSVDLAFWRERLARERLVPVARDGAAEAMIVAAEARFKGVRFREVSFSIAVEGGAFLVQAFNSNRFFAWVERVRFSTPYARANVAVSLDPPFIRAGKTLTASMIGPRARLTHEHGGWQGRVFLGKEKYFAAEIEGLTETYPYVAAVDTFHSAWTFTPREWVIRRDARHAKTATVTA